MSERNWGHVSALLDAICKNHSKVHSSNNGIQFRNLIHSTLLFYLHLNPENMNSHLSHSHGGFTVNSSVSLSSFIGKDVVMPNKHFVAVRNPLIKK